MGEIEPSSDDASLSSSDSLESVFNPHTSSHGLAGVELTKLPLNALTSNQKSNCNARARFWFAARQISAGVRFLGAGE